MEKNNSISIKKCVAQLTFGRSLKPSVKSHQLRGAIAALNRDNTLFHQHESNGRPIYSYPLIQYKIIDGEALIVGLEEGAQAVAEVNLLDKTLYLGREKYDIAHQQVSFHTAEIGVDHFPHLYKFITPWMALNTRNYDKYQRSGDIKRRRRMLSKILIGNLLAMSKGLKHTVTEPIFAEIFEHKDVLTRIKGNAMTGFKGTFATNFTIPEYLGIGKSVSRGFGTIKKYFSEMD